MHVTNLPVHWKVARLGDLGDLVRGVSYKKQEVTDTAGFGYLPVLRATNVQDRELMLGEELVYVKAEKVSDSQILRMGDVIIAMSSGSKSVVGKSAQLNTDWNGSFGAFCAVFRHNSMAESFFIGHIFQTKNYREHLLREARGTNINNLSKNHILDYQFPLPPLPEQRAITHVLQTTQEAKSTRQRELALERERKAALMDYLFSYGTKGEPRKQTEIGEIPESWEVVRLGKVLKNTQYGLSAKANLKRQGYPLLRMNNLVAGLVDTSDLKHIQLDKEALEKFRLSKGDVLFNRTNSFELVGKTGLFDKEGDYVFASYLIRLVTDSQVLNSYFLSFYFNWEVIQTRLKRLSFRGAGQSNISASKLKMFKIPLPSSFEQQKIAEVLCAFDTKTAALEQEIARLDELFHAMLDELMTGQRSALPLIDTELPHSSGIMEGKRLEGVPSEDSPKTETCLRSL